MNDDELSIPQKLTVGCALVVLCWAIVVGVVTLLAYAVRGLVHLGSVFL